MASPEVFSDRYELVRHIARGGMAQVYLAQDLLLDRPVAIKVLFPELSSDPSFVERFRREAQAAANLSHANIVSIYDWGQGEHTYFIVMEYIDGQTLSALIRQGPLSATRAAAIGADMAGALDFAHRRGVIHRDVKPGNVLIDRAGQVKVADFGIARAVSNASEGLTQTGAVMGTATYFSPEQAQGLAVDARSDVYSMGVVLYEMVTGKPPFSGESPVAIAYKHVREYPPLPSAVNASVPTDFEAVVMAAMAKDPEDRYQSAAELRDDLMRFQHGQPVYAAHPGPGTSSTRLVGAPPPYSPSPYGQGRGLHETSVMEPVDYGEPGRDKSRAGWWAALFVVLLGVLGVLVFFIGQNSGWWGHPSVATVPSVRGQTVAKAEATLSSQGFTKWGTHSVYSRLVQPNLVVGSSPQSGARVSTDSTIVLDVSNGPPLVAVPSVASQSCASADTTLRADFAPQNIARNSNSVSANYVIGTDPAAGAKAAQGSTVKVYCSAGKAQTTVPSLTGDSPAMAGAKLEAAHLTPGPTVQVSSDTVKPGLVDYTSPSAGNPVAVGTVVTLYVSGGPKLVTIPPDLVGKTPGQATKELSAVNLGASVVQQPVTDPAKNGVVVATTPAPGQSVRQGRAVTLYVGNYTGPAATSTTAPAASSTTAPAATSTTAPAASSTTAPAASSTTAPAASSTTVPGNQPPGHQPPGQQQAPAHKPGG